MMHESTRREAPLVSVVVPMRNEEGSIASCLSSIEAQEYRPLEVLVIDGDSDDNSFAVAAAVGSRIDADVRILRNRKRTIPSALNVALAAARGQFLVRLDGHARMEPGYIAACVEHLETGDWAGVGGRKSAVASSSFGKAVARAFASRLGSGGSYYHFGTESREVEHVPFGAYPITIARKIGGWDESLLVNQDYEFDHRLRSTGGKILFTPEVQSLWYCRETIGALSYQYYRYGRGKAAVARLHPDSVKLRQLVPPLLPVTAAGGLVAGLVTKRASVAAAVPLAYSCLMGVLGFQESRAKGDGFAIALRTPVAIGIMHWSWGIGFLRGLWSTWDSTDPFRANPVAVSNTAPGEDDEKMYVVENNVGVTRDCLTSNAQAQA